MQGRREAKGKAIREVGGVFILREVIFVDLNGAFFLDFRIRKGPLFDLSMNFGYQV